MEATPGTTKTEVGRGSVAGLAFTPFAVLFTFWIPTLALLLVAATITTGVLDLRGASGPRRRVALLTIRIGFAAVAFLVVVLVLTSGSSSGTAVDAVPPPG